MQEKRWKLLREYLPGCANVCFIHINNTSVIPGRANMRLDNGMLLLLQLYTIFRHMYYLLSLLYPLVQMVLTKGCTRSITFNSFVLV